MEKKTKFRVLLSLCVLLTVICLTTVMAFAEPSVTEVSSEADLRAAIEAIPEGGSGEITVKNTYIYLSQGLYFEFKDVTFNLVNATLVTAADPDGFGQPVILGFGTNITINADGNSTIETQGHTGNMGIVRIENSSDWDPETETFGETFTLTINGGRYTSTEIIPEDCELDWAFCAAPGTEVTLTDVVCNGPVTAIAMPGVGITVPGELTVNGGKFTNDVSEYAADGKYVGTYGENYYVRDKEFSDDFTAPLTDGKLVFHYTKPSAEDESTWLLSEDFCIANPDFYFDPESFNADFSKAELGIYYGTAKEEFHTVDVVWEYDATVLQSAQSFIEKFPEDRPWFNVSDLELVNYWVYHNPESEIDSLANYSGELKSILGNSNFLYNIEVRGGADDVFYTERIGSAKLIFDDTVYFASTLIGARAEHAIYVPGNTAETKEALIAAAQKRIDDYIGANVIKITAATETVTDYYNSEIARYDNELSTAQEELAEVRSALATEQAKDQSLWDWNLITQCQFRIMELESDIEYIPMYKQYFIDQFGEGGDLYFLNNAAGDFFFNVEILSTEETYKFIIVKDDTKLSVPSYASVDFNTQVSVKTESAQVPLDTVVEIEKLTEGTEYDKIVEVLDVENGETFDIKLHSKSLDKYITTLDDGKFEVRLPIPEELKGKENLIVYYVDENDQITSHEVTPEGNVALFYTDHFSIYTLAEKTSSSDTDTDTNTNTNTSNTNQTTSSNTTDTTGSGSSAVENPPTGDGTAELLWFTSLIALVLTVTGSILLLRRKNQ